MRARLGILYLTVFIDLLGFGLVIPILPTYATELGATAFEVGLIAAVYALMNFVFSPLWGTVSDRHGRRPVIAGTVATTAFSFLLLAHADTLWLLFVARTISGIGSANIAASQAYITDVTERSERARALGLIGAAFGLGFIFGPLVGGFVKEHFGMSWVGYTAMCLSLINLLLVWFFLPESIKEKDPHARLEFKPITGVFRALKRAGLRDLFLTSFTYITAFSMMQVTVVLLWEEYYGLSEAQIGYMFAFIGLASAAVQGGLVGKLNRTFGEHRLLVYGSLLMAVGLGSIPFVPVEWFVPLGFLPIVFLALGNGCMMPSLTSLLSQEATEKEQGQVLGTNQSFGSLARVLGPTLGGMLYGWHYVSPYVGGALLMMVTLYVVLAYNRLRKAHPVQ
ncbi:MAG: MFS transporter [Flavobacteriales bacterium]|nr:MFS transporter [Flavobacteriales bacterium]